MNVATLEKKEEAMSIKTESDAAIAERIKIKTTVFREQMRSQIPWYYSPYGHMAFLLSFCIMGILGPLYFLRNPGFLEFMIIPSTFLYANFVEYLAHRFPMHRKIRPLSLMFQGHTLEHHFFFTRTNMTFESPRDFRPGLFPPETLFFFFGLIAFPTGLLFWHLFSPNTGLLFGATSVAYYLNYEIFHFTYHTSEKNWISRTRFFKWMKKHHMWHHDIGLMSRYNFNVTYPISDWVFGTIYRGPK